MQNLRNLGNFSKNNSYSYDLLTEKNFLATLEKSHRFLLNHTELCPIIIRLPHTYNIVLSQFTVVIR